MPASRVRLVPGIWQWSGQLLAGGHARSRQGLNCVPGNSGTTSCKNSSWEWYVLTQLQSRRVCAAVLQASCSNCPTLPAQFKKMCQPHPVMASTHACPRHSLTKGAPQPATALLHRCVTVRSNSCLSAYGNKTTPATITHQHQITTANDRFCRSSWMLLSLACRSSVRIAACMRNIG